MFAREVDSNEQMIAVLEDAILYKIDCEKGEGPEIAKKYGVRGFPTYIAMNGKGEVTDRWIGYEDAEEWVSYVETAKADRRTIAQKKEAYTKEPTLDLARRLGSNADTAGDFKGAVDYFIAAREMDPANDVEYTEAIIQAMYGGTRAGDYTFDQFEAETRVVLKSPEATTMQKVEAALMVQGLAKTAGQPDAAIPYLTAAMEASAGSDDEKVVKYRGYLEIDYALLVEKDQNKAIKLRKDKMPEGWMDDPERLNQFAWWCFENDMNLEEAEEIALRGVELAETDAERANILDTAAEICNARGNCEDAIARIKQAIELDPDKQFFKDQLVKFEQELKDKQKG